MTVYTIGYEGMDIKKFLSLLLEHGIKTIVDVRERPLSRKPRFSKTALTEHLKTQGIDYLHLVKLGCPKVIRDRYREDNDWDRYTEGFLAHLSNQDDTIDQLAQLSNHSCCALLCYEADFNTCHRSMVAEKVVSVTRGSVWHLGM